jgi:hypothetical protein
LITKVSLLFRLPVLDFPLPVHLLSPMFFVRHRRRLSMELPVLLLFFPHPDF